MVVAGLWAVVQACAPPSVEDKPAATSGREAAESPPRQTPPTPASAPATARAAEASEPSAASAAEASEPSAASADAGAPASSPAPWVERTPEEVSEQGNHLLGQRSLYLRQHAYNAVEWYPWGEQALTRSVAEDKPIFLSIGYSSCHWCHVMEHEVFEDHEVAAFLNRHFIAIKVDREERPDLDATYMKAVQTMTGRGGWPMTVFLTPELKPFFGGTYFPKGRFVALAKQALQQLRNNRSELEAKAQDIYSQIASHPTVRPDGPPLAAGLLDLTAKRVASRMDPEWGGLGKQTKFPTPVRWRFLIRAYRKWGDEGVGAALRRTLDRMTDGGLYDHVGGGFHRYTVDRQWVVPHFEKMLYDNAQMVGMLLEAAAAFDEPRYKAVALDTLAFMHREMRGSDTAFYGSYDADSGGHEGSFYVWTPEQLEQVAGALDGAALAALLDVTRRGNFEGGTTVLTRRVSVEAAAKKVGRPVEQVAAVFDRWREPLREARARRTPPGLDKKVVTGWNGLALSAFAKGYAATEDIRWRAAAESAGEFLWRVHRREDGALYRASNGGVAGGHGVLDDYAFLALGYLDLFLATGALRWLERSLALVDTAHGRFAHPEAGWFLTPVDVDAPLGRRLEFYDAVRPSGQSSMIEVCLRLAALTGRKDLRGHADKALRGWAGTARRRGLGMAGWLEAALLQVGPLYEVIVAGDRRAAETQALLAVSRALQPGWAVTLGVPPTGPPKRLEVLAPPTFGKVARAGACTAYVCQRGSCQQPTSDPAVLRAQILQGWVR